MSEKREEAFILWFDEISKGDVGIVGGKNANLGEMYQNLTKAESKLFAGEKINVPYGFAVTAAAYQHFITGNNLDQKIKDALKDLDTHNIKQLEECGHKVRKLILESEFPEDLATQIKQAYNDLAKKLNLKVEDLDVAARSSATAEDLPDASFAGQQESYLNVRGEYELLESIKKAFSSLFTNRAISYRQDKNFDHFEVKLSVAVQKMARSDRGSSGVMFTIDTESGFEKCVIINGAWGLGEFVVKGVVNPDEFKVFKPTLKQGFKAIISKKLGTKEKKLIYAHEGTVPTKEVAVPDSERHTFVLTDEQILKLAKWGVIIEEHYGRAMDIEWAFDTQENQLYIVQARPETVHAHKDAAVLEEYVLEDKNAKVLLTGVAVGAKIGQGKVRYIKDASKISEFKPGEVLVTEITDPDWEPIMKIASAIVTNSGGRTSHAAIVSRELGIPAIVGSHTATKVLKDGQEVTVSCAEGEVGKIYEGIVKFKVNKTDLTGFVPPKVDIKMIAADPEAAFSYAALPQRGVGLLREEFVISNFIKIHPNALIDFEKLEDKELKKLIEDYTVGYDNKVKFYVEKLAFGLAQLAAAFYPYDVLLRFSDFKSNEYANLIGGKLYELTRIAGEAV
jgi:pyruvate,water dikinase